MNRKPLGGSSAALAGRRPARNAPGYGSKPRRSSSVGSSGGISRARWISREEHERLFRAQREQAGIRFSARGCETSWQAYRTAFVRSRACGKLAWQTTNNERAAALVNAGRPRHARTLQRHHALLCELGLLMTRHVRRGRATPGFRDCLHLRLVQSFVIPPTAGTPGLTATGVPRTATASETAGFAGRDHPPPLCGGVGTGEEPAVEVEVSDQAQRWASSLLAKWGLEDPGG